MSDNGALAQAAARILDLERQLSDAQTNVSAANAALATSEHARAAAEAQVAKGNAALEAEQDAHAKSVADLTRQLTAATQGQEAATAARAALAAKFEALHGDPVPEEGIVRGSAPYVTTADNQQHATLAAAREHLIAREVGITPQQAAALVGKAATLMPLIARAAGGEK